LFIVTSIYGIYTVSFLELWSLSEGGFSLSIIEKLKKIETGKEKLNFDDLIQIGREKLTSRMVGLVQLGLVKKTNERVSLTSHGKICYLIFTAIRFWAFPSEKITNGY
jgi:hypothetical protein